MPRCQPCRIVVSVKDCCHLGRAAPAGHAKGIPQPTPSRPAQMPSLARTVLRLTCESDLLGNFLARKITCSEGMEGKFCGGQSFAALISSQVCIPVNLRAPTTESKQPSLASLVHIFLCLHFVLLGITGLTAQPWLTTGAWRQTRPRDKKKKKDSG